MIDLLGDRRIELLGDRRIELLGDFNQFLNYY